MRLSQILDKLPGAAERAGDGCEPVVERSWLVWLGGFGGAISEVVVSQDEAWRSRGR